MKAFIIIVWSWIKQKKYYLLSYLVLASVFVIIANFYINAQIDESYDDIQNEINYGIFENKKSFGTRSEIYTIVSYSKAEIPQLTSDTDSSSYEQQYGDINIFYKASDGWTIKVFKKEGNSIVESYIKPYAVGLKSSSTTSPDPLFRRLYNNIIVDEDYNIDVNNGFKVNKLQNLNSKFHRIQSRIVGIDDGLMWYNYYDGKAYSQIKQERWYNIAENHSKTDLYRALYVCLALTFSTLLYWLGIKIITRKPKSSKSRFNLDISLNKSTETQKEKGKDTDIDGLLLKLNPSNFMSPYDPKKVKIANDLYSALLRSQDNETIVSMIREKAKIELGIS